MGAQELGELEGDLAELYVQVSVAGPLRRRSDPEQLKLV